MNTQFKLNYNGDQRHAIGKIMGPNMFGEYLEVVDAEWDALTDRTTLGLNIERYDKDAE